MRLEEADFGWGNAIYGGPAKGGVGAIARVQQAFTCPVRKNSKGEDRILVPIYTCQPWPWKDSSRRVRLLVEAEASW